MKRPDLASARLPNLPEQPVAAKAAAEVRGGTNISAINATIAQSASENSTSDTKGKPKARRT
jgi:hypothetical protein